MVPSQQFVGDIRPRADGVIKEFDLRQVAGRHFCWPGFCCRCWCCYVLRYLSAASQNRRRESNKKQKQTKGFPKSLRRLPSKIQTNFKNSKTKAKRRGIFLTNRKQRDGGRILCFLPFFLSLRRHRKDRIKVSKEQKQKGGKLEMRKNWFKRK